MAKHTAPIAPGSVHDAGPSARARTDSVKAKSGMEKALDVIERVGNKVPHPAVIFIMVDLDRDRSVASSVPDGIQCNL